MKPEDGVRLIDELEVMVLVGICVENICETHTYYVCVKYIYET